MSSSLAYVLRGASVPLVKITDLGLSFSRDLNAKEGLKHHRDNFLR